LFTEIVVLADCCVNIDLYQIWLNRSKQCSHFRYLANAVWNGLPVHIVFSEYQVLSKIRRFP